MSDELYIFRGIEPFVRASAANYPDLDMHRRGVAEVSIAVKRAGDALSQATLAHPDHRADIAREAERWRDVLAMALEGVEAAILDAYAGLELPAPQFAQKGGQSDAGPMVPAAQSPAPAPASGRAPVAPGDADARARASEAPIRQPAHGPGYGPAPAADPDSLRVTGHVAQGMTVEGVQATPKTMEEQRAEREKDQKTAPAQAPKDEPEPKRKR